MINIILKIILVVMFSIFSVESFASEVDFSGLFEYLKTLNPIVSTILQIIGSICVIASVVDKIIPDDKDRGFFGKILSIPILGSLVRALIKFSPFNYKE